MNSLFLIINIVLLVILSIFTIKTFLDLKESEGKVLEKVKLKLLKDINIMLVLTILVFISTVVNIIIRK